MMRPHLPGDDTVTHTCQGCGFVVNVPLDSAIQRVATAPGFGPFQAHLPADITIEDDE
jgi:hypothetical protein